MNGPTGICEKHGPFLYFCSTCHEEWRAAHPRTSEAISQVAAGKASKLAKARKQDAAAHTEPCRWRCEEKEIQ